MQGCSAKRDISSSFVSTKTWGDESLHQNNWDSKYCGNMCSIYDAYYGFQLFGYCCKRAGRLINAKKTTLHLHNLGRGRENNLCSYIGSLRSQSFLRFCIQWTYGETIENQPESKHPKYIHKKIVSLPNTGAASYQSLERYVSTDKATG